MRSRLTACVLLLSTYSFAQAPAEVSKVAADPAVKAALARIDERRTQVLELWKKLAIASAPSGHEDERATLVLEELRKLGYADAYRDEAGNLISMPIVKGSRIVTFVAHLDTVVQPGVKITITEGKNEKGKATWTGPGVGDDTSGVVALLGVAEAMKHAGLKPEGLVFVFSVNEEGGGKSEGIRRFITDHKAEITAFISTDGSPIDELGAVADNGVGGYALLPVFTGPGVHTIESYGIPSTTRAVALAIERLYKMMLPQKPLEKRSWMNIGTIKAGTVPNAMAHTAQFTVDLRSNDAAIGKALQAKAKAIIVQAAKDAGVTVEVGPTRWQKDPVFLNTPEQKRLIEVLWESYRAIGITPQKGKIGSSDFVIALSQGVPAAGVGLTNIRRMHSPEEEAEVDALFSGMKEVLVAAMALTQR
ncbi:MAG TPA: M20/M25/M40 family metallo-hydrolase [Terriglobales bacterium]|nr:M20/M25/M40 family metallo-hydrolase [Terriglobales bacterium]